ncbi:hypothetical protein Bca52824_042334 [Brassica carinata]|uniref:Uncharacterized protein n=1 Tax=Brassica carinata TaxID=52824 RepID=A0A8X7UX95_BRACI|nr:hypothetical protein Bca52824_042334 [Brassica carinata]
MLRTVWVGDGLCVIYYPTYHHCLGYTCFYRGIAPGVTGSLATGATYFGVIESTKKWIEESHPNLGGHLVHFIAGAIDISMLCDDLNYGYRGSVKDKIQVLSKTAQGKKSNMPNPLSKTSPPITPTKRRIRIIAIAPYSNTVTILNPPVQNGEHQS